jgi:hypothetical protein
MKNEKEKMPQLAGVAVASSLDFQGLFREG